jgi:predicted O-methyltransferase YrrM
VASGVSSYDSQNHCRTIFIDRFDDGSQQFIEDETVFSSVDSEGGADSRVRSDQLYPSADAVATVIAEVYEDGSVLDEHGVSYPLGTHSVSKRRGETLRDLVVLEGAASTIEVGLAWGLSCLFLCEGLLRSGRGLPRHVAIDPFQSGGWGNAGLVLMRRAGLAPVVEFLELDSKVALPQLLHAGRRFDLGFVDGDHKFESVFADMLYMTRLVKPGGLIVVDDVWMPAIRLAVAYFETNLGLELVAEDVAPGAFRWTRKPPWSRESVPSGTGELAVLRQPTFERERGWDDFIPFF